MSSQKYLIILEEKYLFQALDSYPFSLEETIESLDYALSLDPQNTMALTMYGRIYSEQLKNHEAGLHEVARLLTDARIGVIQDPAEIAAVGHVKADLA
mgnify:CR=1 FL=1